MTSRINFASIGARIGLAIGVVVVGQLCVVAAGVLGLRLAEQNMTELVTVGTAKSDAVSRMQLAIVSHVDAVRNIALSSEVNAMQPEIKRVDELDKRYRDQRAGLLALGLSAEEKAALGQADAASALAAPHLKQAVALARTMQPEMAAEILTTKLGPIQQRWTAALDQLGAAAGKSRAAVLAGAEASGRRTLWWMCIASALSLSVGIVLAAMLARGIARRLRVAVSVTRHIADGDLTSAVDGNGRDEVAQTLAALAQMQHKLQATIGEVRSAVLAIETASAEIASGTNDLSSRTEQGAGRLQQTASAIEQLTSTVKGSAENASLASGLAASASTVAERGGAVVTQVVATMQDINASSRRIGDIIGVIDGIAFQTNILALNAAVEAARAGEHGRGFAVVASEVRNLAQKAAQAAKEIKGLVGASVDKVEVGSRLVGDAGATMKDIVASVQRVGEVISTISLAAGEQSQGIGQINDAVTELDRMTQQNAALVEQSAAAAESMREQTARLSLAVSAFRLAG